MSYDYIEEIGMYMDDDGHMLTEDMLPDDMQKELRMQRMEAAEMEMAHQEYEADRRYYAKIRNAYLAGDKEGLIKYVDYQLASQDEFECCYSNELQRECLDAFIKAGELGHSPAIKFLISAYYNGIQCFLEPNFEKFLYWADKGEASDSHELLADLGEKYCELVDKENDRSYYAKAIKVYKKAAELGSAAAMYSLYKLGLKGHRLEDEQLGKPAIPEDQMSTNKQFSGAIPITNILRRHTPDKKAFDYLARAAEADNDKYLLALGMEYFKGRICAKDEQAAFKCFEKLVDKYNKPDPFSLLKAAMRKTRNNNIDDVSDIEGNKEYYNYNPFLYIDNIPAYYNLAYCYENGFGCEVNKEKAFKLYSIISKRSDYANMKVAYFYENGIVVEKNIEKALEIYKDVLKNTISNNDSYIAKPFEGLD